MTWQAYNTWDGYNLYGGATGARRTHAVSFDRPYEAPGAGQFLYNVLGTVVLGERLGVPLAYVSDVDVATRPRLLEGATGYVSLGHDEYWTVPERRHVTKARDSRTNLAFLSSSSVCWRVRLEASESVPNRVVVRYRHDASTSDPARLSNPAQTTSRWRDWPHPEPENSLTGTFYECFPVDEPYRVATPRWWGFRGTGPSSLIWSLTRRIGSTRSPRRRAPFRSSRTWVIAAWVSPRPRSRPTTRPPREPA